MKKKRLIKSSTDLDDEKQCEVMIDELMAHQESMPVKPKLHLMVFEDSTVEALLSCLSDNTPNALIGSDEGGILLNSRVMSQTPSLNSGWSGDSIIVNRKTSESFTLNDARITTHIMVQPTTLERFTNKSKDDVRGNGYLSRFLVCAPPSTCGYRYANGVEHSNDNIQVFNDRVYKLLSESTELDDYTCKKIVCFSNEAKNVWLDVYNDIEHKMGPNGIYQHAKDHASKVPENIARLAALIHFFDNSSNEKISVSTLVEAIHLVGYFSGQFMKVFSAPPKYVTDAENLRQWLGIYTKSGIRYLKRNTILQFGPTGTRKKADLDVALDHLRLGNVIAEIKSKNTRIIDLFPQHQFDEIKFKVDLTLDVAF
tara:strand:- start:18946 stop:20052 length:1107 start_codon:yes stop_codon:yes gene_type:complete